MSARWDLKRFLKIFGRFMIFETYPVCEPEPGTHVRTHRGRHHARRITDTRRNKPKFGVTDMKKLETENMRRTPNSPLTEASERENDRFIRSLRRRGKEEKEREEDDES